MLRLLVFSLCLAGAAALAQDEQPDVRAMKALAPFAGTFTTSSRAYNLQGDQVSEETGTIMSRARVLGSHFSIEKRSKSSNGREYEDEMVFFYDAAQQKVRALLFAPGTPAPREIDVNISGDRVVLDYQPTKFGDQTIVTRETVTRAPDGKVTWLIERKQPDGTYRKTREIVGTPKS